MKSRDVVGKRIVRIEQSPMRSAGQNRPNVFAIVLEDGTELHPITLEAEDASEYGTEIIVYKPRKEKTS
jgi:hypothetical protein